ncbi:MAG: hypothetical protein AAF430_08755 [Myxococcota bacterium]
MHLEDQYQRRRSRGPRALWALLALGVASGCVAPEAAFLDSPYENEEGEAAPIVPIRDCEFMTVWIDYSRQGNPEIGARIAGAMADAFEELGTDIASSPSRAYWVVEILAADNGRRDGYIYSAFVKPQLAIEGARPGRTVFRKRADDDDEPGDTGIGAIDFYNGLAFGPYDQVEPQAVQFVRNAYVAIYPTAKELCDFVDEQRQREDELDRQVPGPPEPL